jgi:hypothetical protein
MRKLIALAAAVGAALAVTVSASAVPCCLTNGSFETNTLAGWTTSGGGWTSGTVGGGAPGQGSFYGWANTSTSAGAFGGLTQTALGPAGRIFGWAKFDNGEDGSGLCTYNDQARVLVDGNQVFYASSYSTGSTGWVKWSAQVNSVGNHTVQAQVANDLDDLCDSQIDLDGVVWDARLSKLP